MLTLKNKARLQGMMEALFYFQPYNPRESIDTYKEKCLESFRGLLDSLEDSSLDMEECLDYVRANLEGR